MKAFFLTFTSHFKVTYYEERMLEVEDELSRVKEDRRQASIQVKIYFISTVFRSRLVSSLSLQYASHSVFPLIFRHVIWTAGLSKHASQDTFMIGLPEEFCVYFGWLSVLCFSIGSQTSVTQFGQSERWSDLYNQSHSMPTPAVKWFTY